MRRNRVVVTIAAIAALVGWGGLALQLALLTEKVGLIEGLWRFVGFFTILTNLGAALVATVMVFRPDSSFGGGRARLMAATSILMVGLVYSIALRALWNPTGLQGLADEALHDAAPLLWLALWLLAPHQRLAWSEIRWALLPPVTYVAYSLLRGAVEGWYAYWFLDPSTQPAGDFLLSLVVLLCAFSITAALLIGADRVLAARSGSPAAA